MFQTLVYRIVRSNNSLFIYVYNLVFLSSRPTTSFAWFTNPMKTFIYLIWKKFKKYIIAMVVLVILTLFLALILYTMPQQISALMLNG